MLSILGLYEYDDTIFDRLTIPLDEDSNPLFDKDTLIGTICMQNAELSLLYADPATVKTMIGLWSVSSQYSWKTLAKTMYLEYNPIWNKDGKVTETETFGSGSTSVEKVSAYESEDFTNRGKVEGRTDSGREFEKIEQGNIGVTSTQQLMKEEREVAEFNIYDAISADFKNRFCVMVY